MLKMHHFRTNQEKEGRKLSNKTFAVKIPIKGFHIVLVDGYDTLDEAVEFVKNSDINPDEEEEDGTPAYGGMRLIATCHGEASAPEEEELNMMRNYYDIDN